MKKTLIGTIVLLFFSAFAVAQNKSGQNTEAKELIQRCDAWDNADVNKDPAPLDKMLTADYIGIDDEGAVTSKADEINLIKSGEYVILSVDHVEAPRVRFFGSTAVVTTHAKVKQSSKGQTNVINGRATTVCVKQHGEWQIASWHASRVKE